VRRHGLRGAKPAGARSGGDGLWTSDDILDAELLPASFIVIGGGAIALEMAHYLEAIGRHVTILQRSPGVLSPMDAECGEAVIEALRKRGITVHTSTRVISVARRGAGKVITVEQQGQVVEVEAEEILRSRRANASHPRTGAERGRHRLVRQQDRGAAHRCRLRSRMCLQPGMCAASWTWCTLRFSRAKSLR